MNNDLISRSELKKAFNKWWGCDDIPATVVEDLIDDTPSVELDESVIQEVLNKRCMTVVANEYLVALHGTRPQGEWKYICSYANTHLLRYECSKCGRTVDVYKRQELLVKYPFCHCGADMRKGDLL